MSDDLEQEILTGFAQAVLRKIGFSGNEAKATAMIRKLEMAGWAGGRDHFFHSFQNYFFGLLAILRLPDSFKLYDTRSRLHWDVDPLDVWFPTALWHDIGYGIEKTEEVMENLFGDIHGEDLAIRSKQRFLANPTVVDGLTVMASLLDRLTSNKAPKATWLPPAKHRKSRRELGIIRALRRNLLEDSHGAAGSLRMYSDCTNAMFRCGHEKKILANQCLWLACASAPFHDWHFRHCLREELGECRIPTDALPFAALLTFVDSIQDDRRNIASLQAEIEFLKEIIISGNCEIIARVNPAALLQGSMLWKIVEASDVSASLFARKNELSFHYPEWMAATAG